LSFAVTFEHYQKISLVMARKTQLPCRLTEVASAAFSPGMNIMTACGTVDLSLLVQGQRVTVYFGLKTHCMVAFSRFVASCAEAVKVMFHQPGRGGKFIGGRNLFVAGIEEQGGFRAVAVVASLFTYMRIFP